MLVEIGKEIIKIKKYIKKIYGYRLDDIKFFNNKHYEIQFKYKKFIIKFLKSSDRDYSDFLEISYKFDCDDYIYRFNQFERLYSYYENKPYNLKFNVHRLKKYLIHLKCYIDKDLIFYEYITPDFNHKYFYKDGKSIEISTKFTPDSALEEKFHDDKYRILNNKPIYK